MNRCRFDFVRISGIISDARKTRKKWLLGVEAVYMFQTVSTQPESLRDRRALLHRWFNFLKNQNDALWMRRFEIKIRNNDSEITQHFVR